MNLSAKDLRAFLALVDERNFTRAAERCHLSQSAFSTLIRTLEEGLGARLFARSTRSVELTPEGGVLAESARRVLNDLDGMVSDFRMHANLHKGRVAIAALPSIAAAWLPRVLAEFRKEHPGIELAVFDALSDQCLAMVRSGQVDFAIASAGPDEADLETELLCQDRFHLVCRNDHPLAGRERVRIRDIAPYPFIHLSRTSSVRQHLEAAIHPQALRTVLELEHLASVAGMVEAGLGVTVVPELTLFHFRRPGLAIRPLAGTKLVRKVYLVRKKGRGMSVAGEGLWGMIRRPNRPTHRER